MAAILQATTYYMTTVSVSFIVIWFLDVYLIQDKVDNLVNRCRNIKYELKCLPTDPCIECVIILRTTDYYHRVCKIWLKWMRDRMLKYAKCPDLVMASGMIQYYDVVLPVYESPQCISTMAFHILVRWHLYNESGPRIFVKYPMIIRKHRINVFTLRRGIRILFVSEFDPHNFSDKICTCTVTIHYLMNNQLVVSNV